MSRLLTAVLVLLMATPALAERPDYNFVEAGYLSVDVDFNGGIDVDGDGYGIGGSFEINDNIFGFASYAKADFDFGVDLTELQAGVGYRVGLTDSMDFYASLSYVDSEIDTGGFGSFDESGYGVTIGVRSNVTDLVELFGTVAYVDLGDSDSTAVGGGIWFNLSDAAAVGLSAAVDDDVTTFGATARWYFGK